MLRIPARLTVKTCAVCGARSKLISDAVGVCVSCLRNRPDEALRVAEEKHAEARRMFGLPPKPPKTPGGIPCKLCANECIMGEGEHGYCGLRWNYKGRLTSRVNNERALLHYYLDPHVTNCCAAWFCPAGTGLGYPRYAVKDDAEYGYYNLALFFYGCNFNCLFCQNWSHKALRQGKLVAADELVEMTLRDNRITCWCWFGGSPEPQFPFAVNASRKVLEEKPSNRVMRVCFEWNGSGNPALVRRAAELCLESGGNMKFDLKAFTPSIHEALTGQSNQRALRNFEMVYNRFYERRREVPVLTATTLLVPHYVDAEEVAGIAEFIASLDPEIPYSLLIFHPDFMMSDVTVTPRKQVDECYKAAKKYLKNVNIGNIALLGFAEAGL